MVMFRPSSLNILVISFLMLSVLLPEMSLKTASPSSLYRPIFSFPYLFAYMALNTLQQDWLL